MIDRKPPDLPPPPRPGDPLLDDTAPEIGTDQPAFSVGNGLTQHLVAQAVPAGKPREPLVPEYAHQPSLKP